MTDLAIIPVEWRREGVRRPDAVSFTDVRYTWPGSSPFTIAIGEFSLARGEKLLLLGPSGSGKSTFLSLLAGIVVPNDGRIEVLGNDMAKLSGAARDRFRVEHFGIIFQMFNLLPYASLVDNVLLPLHFSRTRRERALAEGSLQEVAFRLLEALGLDRTVITSATTASLSVGQQQRVAAARALIGAPQIIVADEPTSALDRNVEGAFLKLLFAQSAAAGASVIMVSHDEGLAPYFDRVVRLEDIAVATRGRSAMMIVRLALQSLLNRKVTAFLTVLAIAVSVMLLLGVEKVRTGARQSFADTISGTDLIVGARSGSLNLLLYSVFRIGNATNNVTWKSYQDIAKRPEVGWIVPLSLGDSHHGFRVLGTNTDYFTHYKFRRGQSMTFTAGGPFTDLFDAVIGADVAQALGYKVGDKIIVAHGVGSISFIEHEDKPFRVSGILAKTGTPIDRTVHVSLEAIEAIHIDWQNGAPVPGQSVSADDVRKMDLTPRAITAAIVGLNSKLATFKMQRAINDYQEEPLSAIMPGVALQELWGLIGTAETALSAVSAMVVVTALLGMVTMILTTLNERRREMAILRSVGATPATVLSLLAAEGGLLTLAGVIVGTLSLYAGLYLARPFIDRTYGLSLPIDAPHIDEWIKLALIVLAGFVAGLLPAIRAYRLSLADGMMVRT